MTTPRESLETVARAVADSGELPSEMSLLLQEADLSSEDANVDLPLMEMEISEVDNVTVNNSDLVGFVTDDNGNRTGRIYYAEYEMTITIDLWTTANGGYDPDDLGERLRTALYPYLSRGPQKPFFDADGGVDEQITFFDFGIGQRADDLLRTPTARLWSQEVELWGCEEFRTDEEYIVSVDYPEDGELNDTDSDGVISDT
jgi:hypothetical protein